MVKHLFCVLFVVSFLTSGLLFAQEVVAPAAPATEAVAPAVEPAAPAAEPAAPAVDLSGMSYAELVSYLSSLSAEEFASVVVEAVNSGDRYLARNIVAAANEVISKADAQTASALIAAVEAVGEGVITVSNNVIASVAPETNALQQKFDVPAQVELEVKSLPEVPTYSAGSGM